MKKIILGIIILSLFFVSYGYAGNASTYKITVQSIQLKTSDGTWVTISSPNREVDIASVSAGATAATLFGNIPPGSYVNFKAVLSETMKFSGSDTSLGVTYYTKAGGDITVTADDATDASTATWTSDPPDATLTENTASDTTLVAEQGEVTCSLNLDAGDADNYVEVTRGSDLNTPIVSTADSEITLSFDFDTQRTVWYEAGVMYFTQPSAGTQFSIIVDGVTTTITEADMEIYF